VGGWDGDSGTTATAVKDNNIVRGLIGNVQYNPSDARHVWQEPRQWLLDQNNNIHRVVGQARKSNDLAQYLEVELSRPIAPVPGVLASPAAGGTGTPYYYLANTTPNFGLAYTNVVTDLWYVPLTDSNRMILTPVYVTVKEL